MATTDQTVGAVTGELKIALTGTVVALKASPGLLYGFYIRNTIGAVAYLQIVDVAAAGVTLGTTVPKLSFGMAASEIYDCQFSKPIAFGTAISVASTTTVNGATGSASDVNFFYA